MKNIIFIAPPAGGKGTQSELVCSKYRVPHISTGDILRSASLEDNDRAQFIKGQMDKGLFVSDNIIYELIKERLSKTDCDNGYVLDGFPRNVDQAIEYDKILENINKEIGCVILLDIAKEEASKRISGRVFCSKCGRTYNINFDVLKPLKDNLCDDCQISLSKRDDDNEETYNTRYQTYLEKTQPLIDYYKNKNVLYTIDTTSLNKEQIFDKIEEIIRGE